MQTNRIFFEERGRSIPFPCPEQGMEKEREKKGPPSFRLEFGNEESRSNGRGFKPYVFGNLAYK